MNITVFTSNQPRHTSLINSLSKIADKVFAIQECNTLFPDHTGTMKEYFTHVTNAEKTIFGNPQFSPSNVQTISIKPGDLNKLTLNQLSLALQSDYYIIFGSSYIKGPLCDFLVSHNAYNIHMGVSPFYRGSACNFWAAYDGHPDLVGATIHLLTSGLDSGPILFHALPKVQKIDPFTLGMLSVKIAHQGLIAHLKSGKLSELNPIQQDKPSTLRYTRSQDFTSCVANKYLRNLPTENEIYNSLKNRNLTNLVRPYIA